MYVLVKNGREKLTFEEFGVHLVSLDGEESTQTTDCFGVKAFPGVGPLKRMGKASIPGFDEGADRDFELVHRTEMIVFEALVFEDTEPDLHQVKPGGVARKKVNHNALVL